MIKKTAITLAAAAAIGTAGMAAAPTPAQAMAWWVVPAIVGGVVVGGATVAAANNAYAGPEVYEPAPGGTVYVRPTVAPTACHWARERVPGGWRRVQVCN
jgi:hypothetical protein